MDKYLILLGQQTRYPLQLLGTLSALLACIGASVGRPIHTSIATSLAHVVSATIGAARNYYLHSFAPKYNLFMVSSHLNIAAL